MTLKTSSLDRYALLLFLSTVFCLVTFIFFGLSQLSTERKLLYEGSDKGRNERSTPRSFILPATPAVALEQERKKIVSASFVLKLLLLKTRSLRKKH